MTYLGGSNYAQDFCALLCCFSVPLSRTGQILREGEGYDARQRRQEELVSAAWRESGADPRVANELDGFMAAASKRLGEEGMRNAFRAASSGRSMTVPGVGREHQAGLDELARSFVQGRDGMALSAAWDQRVEREVKKAERQRARGPRSGSGGGCRRSRSKTASGIGTEAKEWNGSGTGHPDFAKRPLLFADATFITH